MYLVEVALLQSESTHADVVFMGDLKLSMISSYLTS